MTKALRLVGRLAVLAVVVWLARGGLKRWVDGPDPVPGEPWPPVSGGSSFSASSAGGSAFSGGSDGPAGAAIQEPAASTGTAAWVVPNEAGEAPDTHPVKAKVKSRIYHLPGAAAYARTRPDRCYVSAEAAEADGFQRSKR